MHCPGKHVDEQPTKRSGMEQKFGLLVRSFESGSPAIGRLFARESIPYFRGMPRLCDKGEERRTSGAKPLPLDGSAPYSRPIGRFRNSASSNVTAKDKPFRDGRRIHVGF